MTIKIRIEENKVSVGDFSFAIEKKLVQKLERAVRGVTQANPKEDSLFINEGRERKGKTNSSVVESAYLKGRTGREIHLFFSLKPLMEFAQKTEKMIIIWDEPALDSLSTDQVSTLNKDMQRLFMMIGKKRHIFIINYTKFWKFPEYIVCERANGMIHMMEQKKIGRFLYLRHRDMERLWKEKKSRGKKDYKRCSSFGGQMPNVMERCFDKLDIFVNDIAHATYEDYDREKDKSILMIGAEKKSKKEMLVELEKKKLQKKIAIGYDRLKVMGVKRADFESAFEIKPSRIAEWKGIQIPN